jgi:hypothetical protein
MIHGEGVTIVLIQSVACGEPHEALFILCDAADVSLR